MSYSWRVDDYKNKDGVIIFYLQLRYWDGYDRPQYTTIMTVNEYEKNLNVGRFKYLAGYCDFYEPNVLPIFIENDKIEDFINWIGENIKSPWRLGIEERNESGFLFALKIEEDEYAAMAKLTWI